MTDDDLQQVAERVRTALVARAVAAYEDASVQGLCHEGAWEAAVSALRAENLAPALAAAEWPWPAAMDAMIAAPRHHTLLLENARVRVLETRIPPGDTVPVHTHRWPSVLHVLGWSDFVRRDADGRVMADSRASGTPAPPPVLWSDALPPHSLENVGANLIQVISVEIKIESM